MKLFDARICIGIDVSLDPFQSSDIKSIKKMLDKYRIEKAFLLSFASYRLDFVFGNQMTFDSAKKDSRLIPCPTVVPNSGGEVGNEDAFIGKLIKKGAQCVGFYPETCGIALDKLVIGGLFKAIERRRLPIMTTGEEIDLISVSSLANKYPRIPFIYSSPSSASASYRHRNLIPVLKNVKNIYITIAAPFAPNHGIEEIIRKCGSGQILFASNFPISEPGSAISYLLYSTIKKKDMENIAFKNMDRLIKGVRDE